MDPVAYSRFALSLVFVIGLIVLAAWVMRRFGLGVTMARQGGRRVRRLAVVEVAPIDPKRRLVLVRRDDIEHLLLVGGASDLVVETRIPAETFATALAEAPGGPGGAP